MEVHLVIAATRALFLDGGLLWLVIVAKCSCCVDELTLLTQCRWECRRVRACDDGKVVVDCDDQVESRRAKRRTGESWSVS